MTLSRRQVANAGPAQDRFGADRVVKRHGDTEREERLRDDLRRSGVVFGRVYRGEHNGPGTIDRHLRQAAHKDAERALLDAQDEAAEHALANNPQRAGYIEWIARRMAAR